MLMVDRIELEMVDHVPYVRILEDENTLRTERVEYASDEPVDVVDVRENVGCQDARGCSVPSPYLGAKVLVEELIDCLDAGLPRNLCDISSRFDAKQAQTAPLEIAQKSAVIRGNLEHQIAGAQREARRHRIGEGRELRPHGLGCARDVHVITKQDLRIDDLHQLHQRAIAANENVKWKSRVELIELFFSKKPVGQRR